MCYSALIESDLQRIRVQTSALPLLSSFETLGRLHERDPRKYPSLRDNPRVYPFYFAPVVHLHGGKPVAEVMRYSAYPPAPAPRLTTFNARRDNLRSAFWRQGFGRQHGFVLIKEFYEWVAVKDLIAAGAVTLTAVREEFARQIEERRKIWDEAGKKFKLTATEKQDALARKVTIAFKPTTHEELYSPVIFTRGEEEDEAVNGFAIVTDKPSTEIMATGHDRAPIFLSKAAAEHWLRPAGKTPEELDAILEEKEPEFFIHQLAPVEIRKP